MLSRNTRKNYQHVCDWPYRGNNDWAIFFRKFTDNIRLGSTELNKYPAAEKEKREEEERVNAEKKRIKEEKKQKREAIKRTKAE